jgi:NADH:ubiquinone oxidoreductase subunit 6 (subunit J)
MNNEHEPIPIGELLATESVKQVIANMEGYCACEKRAIELENLPGINALEYRAHILLKEEAELAERLRHAPPSGSLRSRRVTAVVYYALTALLVVAGCYFAFISLEPFRFGIKSLIYCAAVAVLTPFLIHCVLTRRDTEKLIQWAAAIACAAAITGVMLLAVIRGNIFMQEFETINAAVVIDDAQPPAPQPETDFYKDTLGYLMAFMLLMSLAMELGGGLALHEGSRMLAPDSEDWAAMRGRLVLLRESLARIIDEASTRRVAPELFAQKFYRDFYRAMLTQTVRSAITKVIALIVCCLALFHAQANAETQPLNLVVAVDLTKSVDVSGPDGKTEFQKNLDAIGKVLAAIPPNTKLTIIGITDASFSQPYILLSATVPDDPGYFGERLRAARNQLVSAWKVHSAMLEPKFTRTDVIGALMLARQIFKQAPANKVLVIFSDMRNNTTELDLESSPQVPSLSRILHGQSFAQAQLQGAEVVLLGVDDSGKSMAYWESLREFWTEYLGNAGATLRSFSTLRDFDDKIF